VGGGLEHDVDEAALLERGCSCIICELGQKLR
jgi:hypothetical protein